MARPATAAVRLLTGEREPVRLATTADIILNGLQAIDGVPAETGDRVLVKDQADPTQNGIYTASEGEWFRAADARTARTLQKGTTVHVQVGSANADRVFEFTSDEPVVGTDAIAIAAFLPPDISDAVDEVEALRDEAQVLKEAAEASAGQAAASASASAANAGQTAADVVATAANLASAQAARDASLYGKGIFPTVAAAIGLGVVGNGAITAGASGTNGTFDLAFTGGIGSGAAGRFVVAGGALTQILITATGSYTVAPSFSFAASAGLAGASAAVVLGRNVDVGEYFWTEVSAGILGLYNVAAGPAATDTDIRAASSALLSTVDGNSMLNGLGLPTAKMVEASGANLNPSLYRLYAYTNGDTLEHVVVAKAAERGSLQLICAATGAIYTANFDLNQGTASGSGANFVSATITALGSGWYECKATALIGASGNNNFQARMSPGALPYTGDGVSGMYVRSIVLRKQNTLANLFASRDPTSGTFTRQNLADVIGTATADAPAILPLMSTVDALDITVNGRMSATKLVEPNVSGSPSFWQPRSGMVLGQTVTLEVIAKQAERNRLNLFSNSGARYDATFNLDLGTFTINPTFAAPIVTMAKLGNGWFRITLEKVVDVAGGMNPQHRVYGASGGHPYVGDGVSGLYVQSSTFKVNGGPNLSTSPTNLSVAPWSRSAGSTATPNAALYLGLLSDPTSIGGGGSADDGSAALVGKKWAALGSSITIGNYYAPLLAEQTGMVLTNLGVSGSALGLSTTAYPSYGMSARIADIPIDTELVALEPGPNAFGAQETPLGMFGDTTYATVYGSLWRAILDIRAQAPVAKIVLIGVYSGGSGHATHRIGRVNGQGNTMDQHMKAEREVCQAFGVPYIDTSQSGMGYHTSTLYMADELHPNAAGSLRLATHHAGALRKMVLNGLFVN
ncbi:membrane hypothetical protein [Mesorhizobium metallidurans STM 2683]|uniref:Uncharacterized protein n=1 Tax=Mesorhizobium metallidurans STM 2683 TaxID=1297569 RepID=M5EVE1_9HYPH|nr:SGNH/GDSL hydrolase family protein [Mesorhizobium metallidurans]CCV07975.1 membrane hypothetical protein [Mesorhizobium metallidurans STM 2683]